LRTFIRSQVFTGFHLTEPFARKVKGFLLKPSETFRATHAESLNSAFQYFVILLIIFSVLLFIVIAVSVSVSSYSVYLAISPVLGVLGSSGASLLSLLRPFLTTYVLFLPYFLFVFLLYVIFLYGFEIYAFVLLFGGQKGLAQTVKTVMYAMTPVLLLGWIPLVSIIGDVWSFVLVIIGIRENQEITTGRAVLVVVVPLVLSLILQVSLLTIFGPFIHALAALPG
jgi:hypothetical protein